MSMSRLRPHWHAWCITVLFAACGSSGGSSDAGTALLLNVGAAGGGSGVVTSSPPGIDCGSDCSEGFALGTDVTLTALPTAGSQFVGWSGAGCSGTGTCTVTVSTAQSISATFEPASGGGASNTPGVALTVSGLGSVTSTPAGINCAPNATSCSMALNVGATLSLTASPAAGYRFVGWSGTCSGTAACNVTVSSLHGVGANFAPTAAFAAGRPYLFKADEIRLRASMAGGDAEAVGSASNNAGTPLGFLTLALAAKANRGSYADIATWNLAFAGWLLNDSVLLQMAHDETMALIGNSTGDTGTSDDFQHVEARLLDVAATVDLAFSKFSAADLTKVATWVNGTLTNWNTQNLSFWPFDEPRNNYWQNGFLAHVIAGVATEGFNPQAAAWRTKAEQMAVKFKAATNAPQWSGPVQSEGHYYAGYVSHALWAMELHDAAMGTTTLLDSAFSPGQQLDLAMFQTRPHLTRFFSVGSEANNSEATHTGVSLSHWYHLAHAGRYTPQAQHAKALLAVAEADGANFWSRSDKGFVNFYWSLRRVPSASLATKSDRMLVSPSPGAGLIGLRSSAGFQAGANAALVFANQFNDAPAYSHSNPDAPGFQWASGGAWLVTDPDVFGNSGILAEAGSNHLSDLSNIVTLAGQQYNQNGTQPVIRFAQDNSGQAVPHYFVQIDASAYWNSASAYRRDYVWLDDLQVVVIFDRIVGAPAKKWRLHVPGQPTISGRNASYTSGGRTVVVRDLLASGNGAWGVSNLRPSVTENDVWRLSQDDASPDYRSLKVLDVGGRVTAATLVTGAGFYQADIVINGVTRQVRFFDSATAATVQ